MNSNLVDELPAEWHNKVNKTDIDDLYIKFVDDKTNRREAEERSKEKGMTEVTQADFMHLYKLSSFVNVIRNSQEFMNGIDDEVTVLPGPTSNTTEPIPLVPKENNDMMLYMPYKDQGQRVDAAAKDLLILGHSLFAFIDKTNFLPSYKASYAVPSEKNSMFKTASIHRKDYYKLKAKATLTKSK